MEEGRIKTAARRTVARNFIIFSPPGERSFISL
jgi:hypothetical protein